ncbi:hypothetical protein DB346_06105 [Verrucomicrobia bacterium LW23]|nr:hypothetical protein DB346_06105 [Verrucomicrobia bacterium LW23]
MSLPNQHRCCATITAAGGRERVPTPQSALAAAVRPAPVPAVLSRPRPGAAWLRVRLALPLLLALALLVAAAGDAALTPAHAARRVKKEQQPNAGDEGQKPVGEAAPDPEMSAATAEDPRPEKVVPAKLRPENERKAKAAALFAEAIRVHDEEGFSAAMPLYEEVLKLDASIVEVYIRIYKPLINRNQPEKAMTLLKKGIEATPDSGTLRALAAEVARFQKNKTEALKYARDAIERAPDEVLAYSVLFQMYGDDGKPGEALTVIEDAAKSSAGNAAFWVRIANIYAESMAQSTKEIKEIAARVLPIYEKALAVGPPTADLLATMADYELILDKTESATAHLKEAQKLDPNNTAVLVKLGALEEKAGRNAEGLKLYEEAYKLKPDMPDLRRALTERYIAAQNWEKAAAVLEELAKSDPTQWDYYFDLGRCYDNLKQPEKAEANYQLAVNLLPPYANPYLMLTMSQLLQRKVDKAADTIAAARRRFPSVARVFFAQALVFRQQKKYEEAVNALQQAKTLAEVNDPDLLGPNFYLELAFSQELGGDRDRSEATLRAANKQFPDHPEIQNSLAYCWAEAGTNLEEALDLSQKSLKKQPDTGAYLDTLGWIYFKQGNFSEALQPLEKAVTLTKDDPVVLDHLAECYLKLGRTEEAIATWKKLIAANPDHKDAQPKLDAAEAALEKAREQEQAKANARKKEDAPQPSLPK